MTSSDVDFVGKSWACPFCYMRNHFPPHYAALSETNLPAELIPNFSTIEYLLPRTASLPPVFLFVVDTCLPEDQIQPLKDALLVAMGLLPSSAIVGLVTFGSTVCRSIPLAHSLPRTSTLTPPIIRHAHTGSSARVVVRAVPQVVCLQRLERDRSQAGAAAPRLRRSYWRSWIGAPSVQSARCRRCRWSGLR